MELKRRRLGASDLEVGDFCLGTMTWGEQNDAAGAHAQIEWALAHGVDFVDTAEMYPVPPRRETQGRTETILGEWLAKNPGRRQAFVLAGKIAGPGRRDWIRNGETHVSAKTIPWAIDDSLARLRTDWIDLYQIHWPDRYVPSFGSWQFDASKERETVPLIEQIEALAAAIRAGKIRAWGLSNETAWGLAECARLAHAHGLPAPASVQNGYNLVSRMFDGDLAETSYRLGIPLLAYSPLAMGLLTGKYTGATAPAAARMVKLAPFGERYMRPRCLEAAAAYAEIARRHGLAPGEMALAFVRSRFFTAATIVGATSVAQLEEIRRWWDTRLAPEVVAEIDEVNRRLPSPSAL